MDPKFTDIHQTLKFGREKVGRRYFIIGLVILAFGILFTQFDTDRKRIIAGYALLALGFALSAFEFHKMFHPGKPLLVLSPEGVRYRIEWLKEFLIPWHEVKALRKIDVMDMSGVAKSFFRTKYSNVTALVVTDKFYDRVIHSPFHGPGWDNLFIPDRKNNVMQVALHHEILPVTAEELRAAVDARWKAFGGADRAATKPADS